MNLFNDEKLAYRLKNNEVSSQEQFCYYIAMFCLYNSHYIGMTALEVMIDIISYIAYRINALGDNDRFIERYVCLSLPIMIKTIVFSIIGAISLNIILLGIFGADLVEKMLDKKFGIGYAVLISAYGCYRYVKDFKIIALNAHPIK